MTISIRQAVDVANALHVSSLTNQHHRSLPIASRMRNAEATEVAFMFAPATTERRVGKHLVAPDVFLFVDATSGEGSGAVRIAQLSQMFGTESQLYTLLHRITPADHKAARDELFGLLDESLPLFATGASPPASAAQLRATYDRIIEPPLAPLYEVLGSDFFAWLRG